MPGKFELYRDKVGKFRFRLKASNGQIILASQAYTQKPNAKQGIESVRKNAPIDERYERKEAAGGKSCMFNLKSANHKVVGTSELYESKSACEKGIASTKKNAPKAALDDQT